MYRLGPSAVALTFLGFLLLAGFSPVSSFGGDGDVAFAPEPLDNTPEVMCNNQNDDNNGNGVDTSDRGCVKPIEPFIPGDVIDRIEGNIWDTDLSTILAQKDTYSETYMSEGLLFSGEVVRGPYPGQNAFSSTSDSGSGSLTEYYIDQARGEKVDPGQNNWAFGDIRSSTVSESDLSFGDRITNGRVIYNPSPLQGKNENTPESCADAIENEDDSQTGTRGNTAGSGGTTFCTPDYGQIYEKNHVKSPYGTDPPGSPGCGCSDSGTQKGPVYYASGDEVVRETEDCESSGDCSCSGDPPSCDTDYSEDTDYSRYDCDAQYSTVDSFGSSGKDVRNDPARTYTEFTAYDDSGWDKAWCAYEFQVTVDADGPRGEGDGLVAIEDRNGGRIAGTWAHDGTDNVGDRVFVEGNDESARNKIDVSCPGDKKVCLKYVDFYTEDSGWTTSSGGSGYKEAVSVDETTLTPEESYSVCKMTNEVASNNGSEERIVNCDYYKSSNPESPLPRACGDDPKERLVAVEGPQPDENEIQSYLAFQQECVRYEDPSPPTDIDSGAYGVPDGTSTTNDDGIGRVEFVDIDKSSGIDGYDGYQDFTSSGKTRLRRGRSYPVTVTIKQNGGQWQQYSRLWIDWNQNQNFESDEEFNIGICATDGCQVATAVTVPNGAELGSTMMRVSEKYLGYPGADEDMQFGEVEDYSIKVVNPESQLSENACVLDGEIYPEGSVVNVADSRSKFNDFEDGGDSLDKEVCVGIDSNSWDDIVADDRYNGGDLNVQGGDNGGEWWDLDNRRVTEYLRNNNVDSQDYIDYWNTNLDQDADSSTGIKSYHKQDGMALEDDCASTENKNSILSPYDGKSYDCEDEDANVDRENPFYAEFREGTMDDDYDHSNTWPETNLDMVHNRVQSGGNTGHPGEVITSTHQVVDTESEWSQGTEFHDVAVDGGYLSSTEDRNNKDLDRTLGGKDVYGVYTSDIYSKLPERRFSNISIDYRFSGGKHPVLIEYSSDSDFSSIDYSQSFLLESNNNEMSFELNALPDYQYMRFKIGVGQSPTDPQVIFTVDESGSMGSVQNAVQREIADFYTNLGSGSEGAVIGGINGDVTPGSGFNTNPSDLETAANRLQANGGPERPEATVEKAVNYNGAGETYSWRAEASRAVIWVQDGRSGETCDGLNPGNNDVGDYMIERNFIFYSATTGASNCRQYYDNLASSTDGQSYNLGSNPDFGPILSDIESDLNTIPTVTRVDSVNITSKTEPLPGNGNTQDDEPENLSKPGHPEFLEWHQNANIDQEDDEWALTPTLEWGMANNGTAYPPEQCHGSPRVQGVDKWKNESVYANSYLRAQNDVYTVGYSDDDIAYQGGIDGNWINPDNDTRSVTSGEVTCDLTGHDWGYAVESGSENGIDAHGGSDYNREGNPTTSDPDNVNNIVPVELTVETNEFRWDMDSNPGDKNQDDLAQWKRACGDDRNEYLIREHTAVEGGEYNPTFSGRNDYYACADRPTDCVLDGEVYSQGQIVDVSDITYETGVQSEDEEICLDRNDELPGGEWWDVDNQEIREDLIGEGTVENPEVFVREGSIESDKPYKIFWHSSSTGSMTRDDALREARDSPYSSLGSTNFYGKDIYFWRGYALEDDCDSDLMQGCDDKGTVETRGTGSDPTSDLIYSHFRENIGGNPIKNDDYSTEGSWVVRTYVNGSYTHGSNTGQMSESAARLDFDSTNWGPGSGWPTSNLNDSKIDPEEDTWAVASEPWDAVGPTGAVYSVGKCYGANPPKHSEGWILKNETVMANSYAKREDVNSDPGDEGNWVDPDTTFRTVANGSLSCDLNSTDWGIGFNTGVGTNLVTNTGDSKSYGYEITDRHAVTGPITFDMNSDPLGEGQTNLQQYPNACGDDKNEYLVREQRSHRGNEIKPNLTHKNNIYVCADRVKDCAYNGNIFSEGQTVDLSDMSPSNTDPEIGDNISDEEICLDLNKTTPGGEWYDKDQNFTVKNRLFALDDTFEVNVNSSVNRCNYDISGRVYGVDSTYGEVEIDNDRTTVDSSGRFSMTNVEMGCGTMKTLDYIDVGSVQAQKRVMLPNNGADIENLVISKGLIFLPLEVWDGITRFKDHDFDYNPGTDWISPYEVYERNEVSFFNQTGSGYNSTAEKTLTSSLDRWAGGEPNDYATGEDCAEFYSGSGTWNDIFCDKKQEALCEYGYRNYETTAPKKWHVVKELCEARGGHLAVIETASENQYIQNNYGNVLIGLYQPRSTPASMEPDQNWQWVNSSGTYQPEAYSTEDDCGPLMREAGTGPCGDVGAGVQSGEWFSAGNFSYGGIRP